MCPLCEVHTYDYDTVDGSLYAVGLVSFIADLRNARARELEEKRINKELANIRYVKNMASNKKAQN